MKDDRWEMDVLSGHLESQAVLDLVRTSLPGNNATRKTEEYWRWKHVDNPFGKSVGTLAMATNGNNENIIAVRSFMQWRFMSGTTELTAVRAVDTVTADAWRGKGIFKQLTLAALDALEDENVDLVFNTPNPNSAPGYLKMGWWCVGDVPLYVRPLRPFRLVLHLLQARLDTRSEEAKNPLVTLSHWATSPQVMALIDSHEHARPVAGLRTPRSAAYLDWRYGAHPHANYCMVLDGPANAPTGLAVVRANRRLGADELVLVELWAQDARTDYMVEVLRKVLAIGGFDHVITHFKVGSVEHAALRRTMFFKVPQQKLRLFVRALGRSLPTDVFSFDGWDLSLGDLELF